MLQQEIEWRNRVAPSQISGAVFQFELLRAVLCGTVNLSSPLHLLRGDLMEMVLRRVLPLWRTDAAEIYLYDAAKSGNVEQIEKRMCLTDVCIDALGPKTVRHLESWEAPVPCSDPAFETYGRTVLQCAASRGHSRAVRTLLCFGANPNVSVSNGSTAMHFATRDRCLPALKVLLEFNGDPHIANKHGYTALDVAISSGHAPAASLLSGALNRHAPTPLLEKTRSAAPAVRACAIALVRFSTSQNGANG